MSQEELIKILLKYRGLESKSDIDAFFNPPHPDTFTFTQIGLNQKLITQATDLIRNHQAKNNPIAIYGDYDVDGITATAILWETLYQNYPLVFPHIPHRKEEGYGLSQKGIDHCLSQGAKLIITLDNGIVAHEEIQYCRTRGCDVIVIDHHEQGNSLPDANVIMHSTSTSAAGLAWFFAKNLSTSPLFAKERGSGVRFKEMLQDQLSLVAISVICDLVPLLGINRSFAKFGLEELNRTKRSGLLALFESAGLYPSPEIRRGGKGEVINAYHVGFIIGPRLNAAGRLEHALDSLRLLCTNDPKRAADLALHLSDTNRLRQDKTQESSQTAISQFSAETLPKLLITASPDYDEGIIGLVAAKLVEAFHRPAIAISIGTDDSKGSARSLPGFHITDHLRHFSKYLSAVGGHAMAAGFTVPTSKLDEFIRKTVALAEKVIPDEVLVKNQRIDAEVELSTMNHELLTRLKDFEPYGLGNPRPIFKSTSVPVSGFRRLGSDLRHLKFTAGNIEAIYFSAPAGVESGMTVADLVYSLDLNVFNGKETLQLVIKDLTSNPSPEFRRGEPKG